MKIDSLYFKIKLNKSRGRSFWSSKEKNKQKIKAERNA